MCSRWAPSPRTHFRNERLERDDQCALLQVEAFQPDRFVDCKIPLFRQERQSKEETGGLTLLAGTLVIHKHNVCERNELVHARDLEKVRVSDLVVVRAHATYLRTLLARHCRGLLYQLDTKRGAATHQRCPHRDVSDAADEVEQECAGMRMGSGTRNEKRETSGGMSTP